MQSEVLELLLAARYIGGPAFSALGRDIDTLTAKTSSVAKAGAALQAAGTALTAAGIAGAAVIVDAVKQAAQYQQSLQRLVAIHAVLPGQMAAIDAAISHTSNTYGQSAKDWADASYFIVSAMSAQNEAVSAGAKNLAIYTQAQKDMGAYVAASGQGLPGSITPLQAASDIPRQAAAWGMKPEQWAMVEAWNTAIERRQNITPSQLLQMTLNAAPGATEAGVSMPQLLAIEGALSTSGDYKARGGTEMKSGLSHLFSKSGQAGARALGLNINSFYKNGQFDLISFIAAAQSKTAGMSPVQRTNAMNALFGQVGNRAFGLLAQPGALAMARANLAAESNNPVAQMYQQAADQMHSPLAQLHSIFSSLSDILRMVGSALLTKLYPALQTVSHFLLNLAGKLHANPALAGKLAAGLVGGTATALTGGPLLSIAGKALMHYGLAHPKVGMADFVGKAVGHVWGFGKALSPYPLLAKGVGMGKKGFNALDTTANPVAWLMEKALPAVGHGLKAAPGAALAGIKGLPGAALAGIKGLPGAALGGLKGVGGGILGFIKGIGPAIAGAIPEIASFGSALLPIVAVVLLVAGAVTALVLIFTRYRKEAMQVGKAIAGGLAPVFKFFMGIVTSTLGMIGKAWNDHKKQIDTAMKGLMGAIKSAIPFFQVVGTVIAAILGVVIRVVGYLVSAFLDALPHLIDFFGNIFKMLGDFGRIIQDVIHGKWGAAWNDAKALLGHAWDAIKSLLSALWSFITGIFGRLWADIGPLVQRVGSGLRDFFGGLWNNISGAVGGFLGGVIGFFTSIPGKIVDALSGLANALKNVFHTALLAAINVLPGPMQAMAKNLLHINNAAHNASGGYIPHALLSWVGEKGPELVALPGGSRVYSHNDSMGMVNHALRPMSGGGFHSESGHLMRLNTQLDSLTHAVNALASKGQQRTPAEEYLFSRQVQAHREGVWERYPNTSRQFDNTYRRAYQYYG